MSYKAFYQTLYQTEQLFRRADDGGSFPAIPIPAGYDSPDLLPDGAGTPTAEAVAAPAVAISDPVLPPPVSRAAPVIDVPALPETVPNVPDLATIPEPVTDVPEPIEPDVPAPVVANLPAPVVDVPEPPAAPTLSPEPPQVRRPATPMVSQKVLILVDEDLLPSDVLFLEKILKAVNLDVTGVDLLNVHGTQNVNFAELLQHKVIHHFFTFGVPFSRINLDIMMDRYHPVRFEGITFLMADSLPAIEVDVALKKKLWESLKKIFLWR